MRGVGPGEDADVEICRRCSDEGHIRLAAWIAPDGTPLCDEHAPGARAEWDAVTLGP